jgi:hypothetical protein
MTIQTNTPWKNNKAIGVMTNYATANTSVRLLVYSGAIPSSSIWSGSFNLATYAAQLLVGWTSFNLQRTNSTLTFGTTVPTATNATGTGTASWVVLCYGPTSFTTGSATDFIIGEPTLTNDKGLVQLSTLNLVTGQSVTPVNFTILF